MQSNSMKQKSPPQNDELIAAFEQARVATNIAANIERIKKSINEYNEANKQLEDSVKKQEILITNLKTMLSYLRQYGNISDNGIDEILSWEIEK